MAKDTDGLRERKDIKEQYKWNLELMYENNEKWEEDYSNLDKISREIVKYKGHIGESSNNLLKVLKLRDEASRIGENLYTYAKMRQDEDTRKGLYQDYTNRASSLLVKVEERMSFIVPEIIKIDTNTLKEYIEKEDELKIYKHFLDNILRRKEHYLSPVEEGIIAQVGDLASGPENVFTMLNNADIKFPRINNENGEEVEITHGKFIVLMESKDRRVRREAFQELYNTYDKFRNTFASLLSTNIKKDVFYSRVRKYNSSLEASLDVDNIPTEVYENLIKAVHNNLEYMYKYMKLRKEALQLEQLHMYDLYTPIVKDVDMKIPYEECKQIIIDALAPLGNDYISKVEEGFNSRWIDVYETKGKRSGAYSWGTYDSKPYILLNYQDNLNSVFTTAHEIGHSLHSHYSKSNQPYIYGGYSIFVAEVASTVNEALLMNYLLEKNSKKEERLYLLNHYLEQFRGTVYRQTMFAEFEKQIHEKVENGESLTADILCKMYKELNEKYYGPHVVVNQEIAMEWARIPHFYYNYYVFQYATGFSAAITLSQKILKEGNKAVKRYLDFLKSGSSDYPINVLKKAGVDLTTPQPVNEALKLFGELVNEMEELLKNN